VDFLVRVRTFVCIADAGSISKAARRVGVSVPMASRHLRSLEAELGAELVRRTTRQLHLTEVGADFLARARRLLRDVDDAKAAVRPGEGVRGTVVVSMPVSLGTSDLAPLLPGLLADHPRLQLDLRFEDRVVDLLADNVDLAIRAGVVPPDSSTLVARRLVTFERVL
jgi:DNA-binding transcriptional LysR family regulator